MLDVSAGLLPSTGTTAPTVVGKRREGRRDGRRIHIEIVFERPKGWRRVATRHARCTTGFFSPIGVGGRGSGPDLVLGGAGCASEPIGGSFPPKRIVGDPSTTVATRRAAR